MVFPGKRGFQLSAARRFFSGSAAAGCSLSLCWRHVAHTNGLERPGMARLLWSASQLTAATPESPREAGHGAGQAVAGAHGWAEGPRLMEASFLPLPAHGPALPWANGITRVTQSHRGFGEGAGRAPGAVCAAPGGSAGAPKPSRWWLSRRGRATVLRHRSRPIASSLPSGTSCCYQGICAGNTSWHHGAAQLRAHPPAPARRWRKVLLSKKTSMSSAGP